MTKLEQVKARAYAIELLEEQIERHEQTKDSYRNQKQEEMTDWEIKELTRADNEIRKLKYVIEELVK